MKKIILTFVSLMSFSALANNGRCVEDMLPKFDQGDCLLEMKQVSCDITHNRQGSSHDAFAYCNSTFAIKRAGRIENYEMACTGDDVTVTDGSQIAAFFSLGAAHPLMKNTVISNAESEALGLLKHGVANWAYHLKEQGMSKCEGYKDSRSRVKVSVNKPRPESEERKTVYFDSIARPASIERILGDEGSSQLEKASVGTSSLQKPTETSASAMGAQ